MELGRIWDEIYIVTWYLLKLENSISQNKLKSLIILAKAVNLKTIEFHKKLDPSDWHSTINLKNIKLYYKSKFISNKIP